MDRTMQIKKDLISRIKDSKDIDFLKALQTIFDSSEKALYPLTPKQQELIETGRAEIRNGLFFENEQVLSEMKEWLARK